MPGERRWGDWLFLLIGIMKFFPDFSIFDAKKFLSPSSNWFRMSQSVPGFFAEPFVTFLSL
jgi:hypothetical protein